MGVRYYLVRTLRESLAAGCDPVAGSRVLAARRRWDSVRPWWDWPVERISLAEVARRYPHPDSAAVAFRTLDGKPLLPRFDDAA